jgi:hypothetical protein
LKGFPYFSWDTKGKSRFWFQFYVTCSETSYLSKTNLFSKILVPVPKLGPGLVLVPKPQIQFKTQFQFLEIKLGID